MEYPKPEEILRDLYEWNMRQSLTTYSSDWHIALRLARSRGSQDRQDINEISTRVIITLEDYNDMVEEAWVADADWKSGNEVNHRCFRIKDYTLARKFLEEKGLIARVVQDNKLVKKVYRDGIGRNSEGFISLEPADM